MATMELDYKGLKCPVPILKMTSVVATQKIVSGDMIVVVANCDTFEQDVREWVQKVGAVLVSLKRSQDGVVRAQVRL